MKSIYVLTIVGIMQLTISSAQEIDFYNSDENAKIEVSADASTVGADASIILHRSDGLGTALLKYDLRAIEEESRSAILGEDKWEMGLSVGDDFKLYHYTATEQWDGSVDSERTVAMLADHNAGRGDIMEVQFPEGRIKLGNDVTLQAGSNSLLFEEPICLISGATWEGCVGTQANAMHEMNAAFYVTHQVLIREEKAQYGLQNILSLHPMTSTDKNNQRIHTIEPKSISEAIPSAMKYYNPSEKTYGIDYDQITAILVGAIQDQQEIINELKSRISILEESN